MFDTQLCGPMDEGYEPMGRGSWKPSSASGRAFAWGGVEPSRKREGRAKQEKKGRRKQREEEREEEEGWRRRGGGAGAGGGWRGEGSWVAWRSCSSRRCPVPCQSGLSPRR